ncbi:uncharacterized protein [Euphorbia lathyris]
MKEAQELKGQCSSSSGEIVGMESDVGLAPSQDSHDEVDPSIASSSSSSNPMITMNEQPSYDRQIGAGGSTSSSEQIGAGGSTSSSEQAPGGSPPAFFLDVKASGYSNLAEVVRFGRPRDCASHMVEETSYTVKDMNSVLLVGEKPQLEEVQVSEHDFTSKSHCSNLAESDCSFTGQENTDNIEGASHYSDGSLEGLIPPNFFGDENEHHEVDSESLDNDIPTTALSLEQLSLGKEKMEVALHSKFSPTLPNAAGHVIPQHLPRHPYSRPAFDPNDPQIYPRASSLQQQPYQDSRFFHESRAGMQLNLQNFKGSASRSSSPLPYARTSGHAIAYNDPLGAQYNEANNLDMLQQNDNVSSWDYGRGSRTSPTVPRYQPGNRDNRHQPDNRDNRHQPDNRDNRYQPGNQPGDRDNRYQPGNQPGNRDNRYQPGNRDNRDQPGNRDNRDQPGNWDNRYQPGNWDNRDQPGNWDNRDQPGNWDNRYQPGNWDDRYYNFHGRGEQFYAYGHGLPDNRHLYLQRQNQHPSMYQRGVPDDRYNRQLYPPQQGLQSNSYHSLQGQSQQLTQNYALPQNLDDVPPALPQNLDNVPPELPESLEDILAILPENLDVPPVMPENLDDVPPASGQGPLNWQNFY